MRNNVAKKSMRVVATAINLSWLNDFLSRLTARCPVVYSAFDRQAALVVAVQSEEVS